MDFPRPNKYEKTSHANTYGQDYEVKLALLLFIRGINSGRRFNLATNFMAGGKFDDIIFQQEVENQVDTKLIQLKHKENKSIATDAFKSYSGDYSLLKYYRSYYELQKVLDAEDKSGKKRDIKALGDLKSLKFILYTNSKVHFKPDESKSDEGNLLNAGGVKISFNQSHNKDIHDTFEDWILYNDFLKEILQLHNEGKVHEVEQVLNVMKVKINNREIKTLLKLENKFEDESYVNNQLKWMEKEIGDLSKYKDFLQNFSLYSEQAHGNALDKTIMNEIEIAYNTNGAYTEKIFKYLANYFREWHERKKKFLNDLSPVYQNALNLLTSDLQMFSEKVTHKLRNLGIVYREEELEALRQTLKDNRLTLVTPPETMTILSSLKVFQAITNEHFIFTDTDTILMHENDVISLWGTKLCRFLIVEDNETHDIKQLSQKIDLILQKDKTKTFIIVGQRTCNFNKNSQLNDIHSFYDQYNLTSFNRESQDMILKKKLIFQGYEVTLRSMFNSDEVLKTKICNDFLCQILSERCKVVIGKELMKGLDYYVPRTLKRHVFVNETELQLLVEKKNSNIAISGTHCTHKTLERKCIRIDSSEESFLQESAEHKDFHWFHREKGERLVWRKSKGNMDDVYESLDNANWRNYNPETLKGLEEKVILLVAKPGMGKSTLLTHLSEATKKSDISSGNSTWVVRVNLNDCTSFLRGVKVDTLDIDNIIKFLENEVLGLKTETEKDLFQHSLKRQGNIAILFDGYDEISPIYCKAVSCIIKLLQEINQGLLWVTSRPVLRQELERGLSTLAFGLQPFRDSQQSDFLQQVWKTKFPDIDRKILKEFVSQLLQLTIKSLSDTEKEFTGVPLQTMMLAEIFEDGLRLCSKTQNVTLPPALNLLQLYEDFVRKKFEICLKEKRKWDLSNAGMQDEYDVLYKLFTDQHKMCALMSLFSTQKLKLLPGYEKPTDFLDRIETGREKTGIIEEMKDGKPHFIHKTFAEYFSAIWFSENYRIKPCQNFLSHNLFSSDYDILRNIFDRVLAKDKMLHIAVLNTDLEAVSQYLNEGINVNSVDEGGRTPLHLAVVHGKVTQNDDSFNYSTFLYHQAEQKTVADDIVQILLERNADTRICDKVLGLTPLQYADSAGCSFRTIGMLLEYGANSTELVHISKRPETSFGQDFNETVLIMSVEERYKQLISYMIDNGVKVNCKLPLNMCRVTHSYTTMLHKCIQSEELSIADLLIQKGANINEKDSELNTPLHIAAREGKLESIKFLLNKKDRNGINIDVCNRLGDTPLHLAVGRGNLHIIKCLIEEGANIQLLKGTLTVMHLAAFHGHLDVVKYLFDYKGSSFFKVGHGVTTTPLHLAVTKGNLGVVEYFISKCVNVNMRDKNGNTALHNIIMCSKPDVHISILRCLIEAGAKINLVNKDGETVLFWAVECGDIELLKYLDRKGAKFDVVTKSGDSLLFQAVKNENCNAEIIRYLLEKKKLNLLEKTDDGNNILHIAVKRGNQKLASFLFKEYRSLNETNKHCETPLYLAALAGHWDIVKELHKLGANLSARNGKRKSILHIAAEQNNLPVVKWLLERKSLKASDKTEDGNTVLHYAAKGGAVEVLEYFAMHNADFNEKNGKGETLLHIAVQESHLKVVQFLKDKISLHARDNHGNTPLHTAVMHKSEIAEVLVNCNANISEINANFQTPLHVAVTHRDVDLNVVQLLLRKGANVNSVDAFGNTPLLLALESENIPMLKLVAESRPIQPNLNTCLLSACWKGLWPAFPCLIENGADVNIATLQGWTPLHRVAWMGELYVADYLIRNGACEYKTCFVTRVMPLHLAAFRGNYDIVKLLVRPKWMNINATDIYGNTALDCAIVSRNQIVAELLRLKGARDKIKPIFCKRLSQLTSVRKSKRKSKKQSK